MEIHNQKKLLLLILDGWGIGKEASADAILAANTPFMDSLYPKYPHTTLTTFGYEVGLPEGQMGNSEVGHLNIGAGRVVYQALARINKAIDDNQLAANKTLIDTMAYAKTNQKPIHLLGLVSDGGVHSHLNHLKALVEIIEAAGVEQCYIHAFTDGRDCDPHSGAHFLADLQQFLVGKRTKIATLVGRYYAMDRDNRWERVVCILFCLHSFVFRIILAKIETILSRYYYQILRIITMIIDTTIIIIIKTKIK